jgi:hypothetical protein
MRCLMKRTAQETAILAGLLMKRASARRARISEKTIRFLSKRRTLRTAFLDALTREMDDLGLHMVELDRGGFAVITIDSLDGAPTILAKNHLMKDLAKLAKTDFTKHDELFGKWRDELEEEDENGQKE